MAPEETRVDSIEQIRGRIISIVLLNCQIWLVRLACIKKVSFTVNVLLNVKEYFSKRKLFVGDEELLTSFETLHDLPITCTSLPNRFVVLEMMESCDKSR